MQPRAKQSLPKPSGLSGRSNKKKPAHNFSCVGLGTPSGDAKRFFLVHGAGDGMHSPLLSLPFSSLSLSFGLLHHSATSCLGYSPQKSPRRHPHQCMGTDTSIRRQLVDRLGCAPDHRARLPAALGMYRRT
eukprot:1156430-Pelagomonas_calceolata.AAC.4